MSNERSDPAACPDCAGTGHTEDFAFMGTREEADARFMAAADKWIELRQPLISNAAAHKKRDVIEHEARFQLANAAIHLAWFMRRDVTNGK